MEVESSSEDEKPAKKSHSNNHKNDKKANGASTRREKIKAAEARLEKLQSEFKQQVISENIISKIDKNIELLQNAKKSKHENKKSHPPKKIISEEISSNEEEELLKSDKRKSNSSPRKRDRKRLKNSNSRRRSKSPSSPVDVSVSLKSKREFEQMKAELNKKASKSEKKEPSKPSPRKESRFKGAKEVVNSPPKQENKTSAKSENNITPPTVQDPVKQDNGTKPVDMDISEVSQLANLFVVMSPVSAFVLGIYFNSIAVITRIAAALLGLRLALKISIYDYLPKFHQINVELFLNCYDLIISQ